MWFLLIRFEVIQLTTQEKILYCNNIYDKMKEYNLQTIEKSFIFYLSKKTNVIFNYDGYSYECYEIFEKSEFPINIELIISFFEYLIDKKISSENGIVFTPKYIADYIVAQSLSSISKYSRDIKIVDPGCGCGIFLISAIEYLHNKFHIPYQEIIYNNIFGIDIIEKNVEHCKLVISIFATLNGIMLMPLDNIIVANSLDCDWRDVLNVNGIDYVIGNPPYVNTHDLPKEVATFLKSKYKTTTSGVFNIFYAFIEKSLEEINETGNICFIVPNNFLTIKSAEQLRLHLQSNKYLNTIIDFSNNMVFKPIRTYNCIIKLSFSNSSLNYFVMPDTSNVESELKTIHFNRIPIDRLNPNGWKLVDSKTLYNLKRIESQKTKIKDFIRTGIATLRDNIYFVEKDSSGFFKSVENVRYEIEPDLVKTIYKTPDLKGSDNITDVARYIIFPYKHGDSGYVIIPEEQLKTQYPLTYRYLLSQKAELDKRDKGKKNSVAWYAYGRTQGLNKYGKKLLFPTFADTPRFIRIDDVDALFCNGYAVFENDFFGLNLLAKILNSKIMEYYVKNTSYTIEGGYYCYQKKYIENFSIPTLTVDEVNYIVSHNSNDVNSFLFDKYKLKAT